jgi:hypothetical protein
VKHCVFGGSGGGERFPLHETLYLAEDIHIFRISNHVSIKKLR